MLEHACRRASASAAVALVVAIAAVGHATAARAAASADPTATEIGVSATEIHIAVVADVDNPIIPGLFQGAVDGVRGAADYLNSKAGGGGIAGRKLVVDFIDSKLNGNATRNATIVACGQDLAMVGTSATALTTVEDMVNCKDKAGAVTGLPDVPAISGAVEGCAPVAYPLNPNVTVCSTIAETPQTYQTNQGAFVHLTKTHPGLHGVFVGTNDTKAGSVTGQVLIHAATGAGVEADATMPLSALAPQSAYTPVIQEMKQSGSNFEYSIGPVGGMISVRSEAQLQGLTDPDIVWVCTAACYDKALHDQAEVMEGTYIPLQYLPFEEAKTNATLANFVKWVGKSKVNGFAAYGWGATLAFADAVKAAVAKHGINGLTRSAVFEGLQTLTAFDAGGMFGRVDVAHRRLSPCTLLTRFEDDEFVRIWPSKRGTFNCSPSNRVSFTADYQNG